MHSLMRRTIGRAHATGKWRRLLFTSTGPGGYRPPHHPRSRTTRTQTAIYAPVFHDYADPARLVELSDTGHFELINPRSKQWPQIVEIVTALR